MDPVLLQAELVALRAQNALLQEALAQSRQENQLLRQKLDALLRRVFGRRSERLDQAQLELLLGGLAEQVIDVPVAKPAAPALTPPPLARAATTHRLRVPDNLEVRQEVIEPELVAAQPGQWQRIGEEVSRRLDYQPGQFFWQEIVRPKYVRRTARALPPVLAPAPPQVAGHSLAAPGLLAFLFVCKFCDHLPFYRLEKIFRQRHGVFIARQQMMVWLEQSIRLLEGIYFCLMEEVRQSGYVQVDETPVRYQDPETPGRCGQGYLWTALVPGQVVVYQWHASRAAACLEALRGKNFRGHLQCDGFSAYPAFAKAREITLCGCWAHARRGFFEAKEQAPTLAGWILRQLGWLYRWEEDLRQRQAGPQERAVFRAAHSRMVVARLERVLKRLQPGQRPKSLLGEAISYALNQWPALIQFLGHGAVELDNNLVENAIRPAAIGRKNWLCFGPDQAGQRGAVMYTLIENCRRNGIDPLTYLKDVLTRLPSTTNRQVAQLTPRNWQAAREKALRQAA